MGQNRLFSQLIFLQYFGYSLGVGQLSLVMFFLEFSTFDSKQNAECIWRQDFELELDFGKYFQAVAFHSFSCLMGCVCGESVAFVLERVVERVGLREIFWWILNGG